MNLGESRNASPSVACGAARGGVHGRQRAQRPAAGACRRVCGETGPSRLSGRRAGWRAVACSACWALELTATGPCTACAAPNVHSSGCGAPSGARCGAAKCAVAVSARRGEACSRPPVPTRRSADSDGRVGGLSGRTVGATL